MPEHALVLLLIEDEERDAQLLAIAVEEAHLEVRLQTVTTGQAAADYLLGRGKYARRLEYPFPDLIILDLLLPMASGTTFLNWRRASAVCNQLPLVILTGTLDGDQELQQALQHDVNRAYTKPSSIYDLVHIVREIYALGMDCKTGHSRGHEATR